MNNSGKYLENTVRNYYESLKDPKIILHRFNDSTAGRNLTAAQPADFIIINRGQPVLLECKSTKHAYRLPKFDQHARMRRWAMSGTHNLLLVHHYNEDVYRVVPVCDLEIGKASFDLRPYQGLTFDQAMGVIFCL